MSPMGRRGFEEDEGVFRSSANVSPRNASGVKHEPLRISRNASRMGVGTSSCSARECMASI